jgi:hypothetical protein
MANARLNVERNGVGAQVVCLSGVGADRRSFRWCSPTHIAHQRLRPIVVCSCRRSAFWAASSVRVDSVNKRFVDTDSLRSVVTRQEWYARSQRIMGERGRRGRPALSVCLALVVTPERIESNRVTFGPERADTLDAYCASVPAIWCSPPTGAVTNTQFASRSSVLPPGSSWNCSKHHGVPLDFTLIRSVPGATRWNDRPRRHEPV